MEASNTVKRGRKIKGKNRRLTLLANSFFPDDLGGPFAFTKVTLSALK